MAIQQPDAPKPPAPDHNIDGRPYRNRPRNTPTPHKPAGRPMYQTPLDHRVELTLVGTGHVFDIGALVETIIDTRQPDIVCVELDPVRLRGLQEKAQLEAMERAGDPRAKEIRDKQAAATKKLPFVYRMLARAQEDIAGDQGVTAGSEMLAAVQAANRRHIPAACIDVDAQALIKRAWSEMKIRERFKFLFSLWRGKTGKTVEAELEDYQNDPVAYLAMVGDEFPTLKRVLIDERDTHMANAILALNQHKDRIPGNPETLRVVAVVGDGHVTGMKARLVDHMDDDKLELVRVQDLRSGTIPDNPFPDRGGAADTVVSESNARVSFDVHVPEDQPE